MRRKAPVMQKRTDQEGGSCRLGKHPRSKTPPEL